MTASFTTTPRTNEGGLLEIEVPEAAVRKLDAGKRVPVRVTINDVTYRSTIAVYGGRYYLPARKEIREAAKLEAGRAARVSLALDSAPRTVTVPSDLARALAAARLTSAFAGLSYTHRKEIAEAINAAKRAETRAARIRKAVAEVRAKARPG